MILCFKDSMFTHMKTKKRQSNVYVYIKIYLCKYIIHDLIKMYPALLILAR